METSYHFNLIFSERYRRAVENGSLQVELTEDLRRRIAAKIHEFDGEFSYSLPDNPTFILRKSIFEEVVYLFKQQKGLIIEDEMPHWYNQKDYFESINNGIIHGSGIDVLDLLELVGSLTLIDYRIEYRHFINGLMRHHCCPWRLAEGQFVKLDNDFMGAELVPAAIEQLGAGQYSGPLQEFQAAQRFLQQGDYRQAIHSAASSVESMMQLLTGQTNKGSRELSKAIAAQGLLDDSGDAKNAMTDNVLNSAGTLRNKLGGHGQGPKIVPIPKIYADLTINLAAALNSFLIAKHIEKSPPMRPQTVIDKDFDDNIPY